jgi:hypothetical protein
MNNPNIDQTDLINIVLGIELAINRKAFSREEAYKIFPSWNNIASILEKNKRSIIFEQQYAEVPVPAPAPVPEPVQVPAPVEQVPIPVPEVKTI